MHSEFFESWMKQPGSIKKLQGVLALSVILNLFLFMQFLPSTDKVETVVESQTLTTEDESNKQSKITEEELKEFVGKYMQNFFSSNEEALNYIKTFSSENLFERTIKKEMETRMEQKIISEFKLDDLFLDSVSSTEAKAIILGRESFPNRDYEERSFTIELIINTEKLQVESIPVFKVS